MSLLNMLFRLGTEVAGLNTDLEMIPTDDSDGGDADGSGSEGGDKDETAESSGDGSDDGADVALQKVLDHSPHGCLVLLVPVDT